MKLKSIEIAGFKSFAKTTVLEFPSPIVAIVGPNGSGKSNIAEAIRWVLGEQSMKSLRGKRGEDLIFSGTPKASAMGKASVMLHFDNSSRTVPLDFDMVSLGRKIFRDGLNEYYLNGSQVRLRDIVELLAKIGLGETKHNIIGQGEVDRILLASSRDRRSMLEEALGLRVYQLKKKEAFRKLAETEENMKRVEDLVKEIAPHLKYLKNLKERAEQRGAYEGELREFQISYFSKVCAVLEEELKKIQTEDAPLNNHLKKIEEEIVLLQKDALGKEETAKKFSAIRELDITARAIDQKRVSYERELGRLEGKIEAETERSQKPIERIVDIPFVVGEIQRWHNAIHELLKSENIELINNDKPFVAPSLGRNENEFSFRSSLATIKKSLGEMDYGFKILLETIAKGKILENPTPSEFLKEFEKEKQKFQELIENLNSEAFAVRAKLQKEEEGYRAVQQDLRTLDRVMREKEEERSELRLQRERTRYEIDRIEKEKARVLSEMEYAGVGAEDANAGRVAFDSFSADELRKKIEKTKIRLEEIGGVDENTMKEYEATETRYAFLSQELSDMTSARVDLDHLIKDLDGTIERDFEDGFAKIQNEFQNYFKTIFGGGNAILRHEAVKPELDEEGNEIKSLQEDEKKAFGIEIDVDLPRKRIKSMAMLSGGERALTAIALLFAISAVNPPPFLVLDETDAALDEANSKLYADTLVELSKKTDLVIITHNRETMKQSDILYGVTMGDDGISKLLSLKLEEARQYANR
ncbi:MAG: AAA family ATPase [Patescibacteria group bacterium]